MRDEEVWHFVYELKCALQMVRSLPENHDLCAKAKRVLESDVSENRFRAAILNDCKYGISAWDTDVRLTLHQGGCHPDITADAGAHEVTYSLLPHVGAMNVNNVTKSSYMLNVEPVVARGALKKPMESYLGISCDHVICEAVKCAELVEGAIVLRFYEAEKAKTDCEITLPKGYPKAYLTNMLEEVEETLPVKEGKISLSFHPFQLRTVMLRK